MGDAPTERSSPATRRETNHYLLIRRRREPCQNQRGPGSENHILTWAFDWERVTESNPHCQLGNLNDPAFHAC